MKWVEEENRSTESPFPQVCFRIREGEESGLRFSGKSD